MDRIDFPQEFTERMHRMLCGEDEAFLASLESMPRKALRLNPLCSATPASLQSLMPCTESVPWESMGYYIEGAFAAGRHPYHEAGVYYIQEPSAMAPVSYLDVRDHERILDLCAAPGGKSTQIAGRMAATGLLLCNEIHPGRASILSENIERMGVSNALVTNETPKRLSERFPLFFDKVLVDAPCSGEGMFRKNPEALTEWSVENVKMCAARQDEILDAADEMLKIGGRLVYSTCTFAPEEDEGTIVRFLIRHPQYHVLSVPLYEGMENGDPIYLERIGEEVPPMDTGRAAEIGRTVRIWPHKAGGEGHFLAVLVKGDKEISSKARKMPAGTASKLPPADRTAFAAFLKTHLRPGLFDPQDERLIRFGDHLYRLPEQAPSLKGLKVLRPGLMIGTFKKDRFEPAHSLSHFLKMTDVVSALNLPADSAMIKAYLNGQTISPEGVKAPEAPWTLVCTDSFSLGWSKYASGIYKNHYPKGLRIPI